MGDVIENLITLVLWIVASYYLRSKRRKAEEPRPSPKPLEKSSPTTARRRSEPDPLEESARNRPKYPANLDELDEAGLQEWEERLLAFAEASGMVEDEDGWEVPWSGYRYYDLDELYELYVHRHGKPLSPPAQLVLVEGPNGEQMPVLVPSEPEEEVLEERAPTSVETGETEELVPTIVIVPPKDHAPRLAKPTPPLRDQKVAAAKREEVTRRRSKSLVASRQALLAGVIMSEVGILQRRRASKS